MARHIVEFTPLPETKVFRNTGGGITITQDDHIDEMQTIILPLSFVDEFCLALQEVRDAELPEDDGVGE